MSVLRKYPSTQSDGITRSALAKSVLAYHPSTNAVQMSSLVANQRLMLQHSIGLVFM